jgi:hypothetical protein
MDPDKYKSTLDKEYHSLMVSLTAKNKKGKESKNWEPQYKSVWMGKKR